MPTKAKLSDMYLRNLPLRESGQETVWDEDTAGFGIKIGTRAKSFIVRYHVGGREREMTLGRWPELKLADARKKAREVRSGAYIGEDALAKRQKREDELAVDARFDAVIRRYWGTDARHKALRQRVQEERLIENHVLPHWRDRPVADITSADALDLLEGIAANHPIQANRVLFALRRPFRWAVQRRLMLVSPVESIERLAPENKRERVLNDAEVRAIWNATEEMGVFGLLVRGLFVSGSRRDEVRDARWEEFDFEGLTWTRPAARMKAKVDHVLPVTPIMETVLSSLGRGEGFVFSTDGGKTRYGAMSRAKRKLDRLSGVADWTLHDIRRTVRTRLAALGVPFEVAEKVLAHRTDKIEAVYNKHQYVDEKRGALLRWEGALGEIVGVPIIKLLVR